MVLAVLAFVALVAPDEGRSRMPVPALTVFEGMLRFAGEGEDDRMRRSLDLLQPVLAEHEAVRGPRRVEPAAILAARGPLRAAAVRRLIAVDVVVLLSGIGDLGRDRARTRARTALLEWRLVEEAAIASDLRDAQGVASALREVVALIDDGDPEGTLDLTRQIAAGLQRLFP